MHSTVIREGFALGLQINLLQCQRVTIDGNHRLTTRVRGPHSCLYFSFLIVQPIRSGFPFHWASENAFAKLATELYSVRAKGAFLQFAPACPLGTVGHFSLATLLFFLPPVLKSLYLDLFSVSLKAHSVSSSFTALNIGLLRAWPFSLRVPSTDTPRHSLLELSSRSIQVQVST